jgi:microsomal dipeptidase-like Zn-dependent dipeptidase
MFLTIWSGSQMFVQEILATVLVQQGIGKQLDPVDPRRINGIQQDQPAIIPDWRGFEALDAGGRPKGWDPFRFSATPDHVNPSAYPLPKTAGGSLPPDPITLNGDYWVNSWFRHLNSQGFKSGADGQNFYSTGWSSKINFTLQRPPDEKLLAWVTSDVFSLENDALAVLLGGTRQDTGLQIEVWVEGVTSMLPAGRHGANLAGYGLVHRFLGTGSEQMTSQVWNIPATFRGKNAKIFILDDSRTGHLNFDGFKLIKSSEPSPFVRIDPGVFSKSFSAAAPPIYGWADLHAHPVAHMSSGGHYVWGSLGGRYEAGIAAEEKAYERDMPACDGGGHGANGPENWISKKEKGKTIRDIVYGNFNGNKHQHDKQGYPGFGSWPHRYEPNHQQMHVNWIRRAYEGGQRLMVASVLENQVATYLLETGFRGDSIQRYINPETEVSACVRQANAIKDFARANSAWMGIATTPAEARQLASQNKLIVVLSVETDWLTSVSQLRTLHDNGVRVFTMVHLIDNFIGGAAAYSNLFNSMNGIYNGRLFQLREGKTPADGVTYRFEKAELGELKELASIPTGIEPTSKTNKVFDDEYASLRGHMNAKRLTREGVQAVQYLAQVGDIIDLAHAGQDTITGILNECVNVVPRGELPFPTVWTHGGIRTLGAEGSTERSMQPAQMIRMIASGGTFGIGTSGGTEALLATIRQIRKVSPDGGISLGTDMNGGDLNADPRRFGSNKVTYLNGPSRIPTGARFVQDRPSTSPQSLQRLLTPGGSGRRYWDINKDGLAHYGLIPDYLQDLYNIGATDQEMMCIFRGAEGFVRSWERAYSLRRR